MRKVHDGPRGPGVRQTPLPANTGALAATDEVHRYEPLTSLGESLCVHCFGFSDDARHYLSVSWQYAEDMLCKRFEDRKEWEWVTEWPQAA